MKKVKSLLKKLNGRSRLFFGFCPKCNSDAPELYNCSVCEHYRTSESGMPSHETKREWWKRFVNEIERNEFFNLFVINDNERPFYIDTFRKLLRQYDNEEISLSKLVEDLNFRAYQWKNKRRKRCRK